MKKLFVLFLSISMLVFSSCKKESSSDLGGSQSPMGNVGVTVTSSPAEIAGVSNFSAIVASLQDGVSSYTASATVTNPVFKNMLANFPGVTINGDVVSISDMQIQQTSEGMKNLTGPNSGILVKYDSEVGDTYPIGSTGKVRTVVSKTGVDDYYYGGLLIKTIQVEMNPTTLKSTGISKYTFVYNHKFGLVGVKVTLDDGSSSIFPVFSSVTN